MEKTKKQSDIAIQLLSHALSCPPSRTGMRLQPEGELSRILGVGRKAINTSLTKLSQDGIVGRRRGSGTFVRKVTSSSLGLKDLWSKYSNCSTSKIFATNLVRVSEAEKSGCGKQKLNIGLWGDWQEPSVAQQARISGILQAVEAEGHSLELHSLLSSDSSLLSRQKLKDKILNSNCCGYLVVASLGRCFSEIMQFENVPIVYCGVESDYSLQPSITQSFKSLFGQSLEILKHGGYNKVGIAGVCNSTNATEHLQNLTYNRAVEDNGLTYRKSLFFDEHERNHLKKISDFLTAKDRPDAVYITDDTLIPHFKLFFELNGIEVGKDLGLICLVNEQSGINVPENWSKLVFDQKMIGRTAADLLIRIMSDSSHVPGNIKVLPTWIPAETHKK